MAVNNRGTLVLKVQRKKIEKKTLNDQKRTLQSWRAQDLCGLFLESGLRELGFRLITSFEVPIQTGVQQHS